MLSVDRAGLEREIDLRHRHRRGRDAERLAQQQPFRPAGHAQLDALEIGGGLDVAPGPQVELARSEIGRRQDDDAHPLRDLLPVALPDRPAHDPGGVVPVAQQECAIEEAPGRNLLRHLEGGHRAHLEIAALNGRHLGALPEQARPGMHAHVELVRRGLVDLLLEALERFRQEIGWRSRGGEAQQDPALCGRRLERRGDGDQHEHEPGKAKDGMHGRLL